MLRKMDRILFYFMPLAVIGIGFMNMVTYYINGHQNDTVRRIIVWGTLAVFLACLSAKFLMLLIKATKDMRKRIIYYCALPLIYVLMYCAGILCSDIKEVIIKQFIQNFFIFALMFCGIICIVLEEKVKEFLALFKWYNILVLPLFFFYVFRLLFSNGADYPNNINLGEMSYMDISYFALTLMLVLCLDLVVNYNNRIVRKRTGIYFLLVVDTIVLWFSATKGAILCAIALCMALVLYAFVNKNYRITNLISCALIILSFSLAAITPMIFKAPLQDITNRQDAFIDEIVDSQQDGIDSNESLALPSFELLEKENAIIRKVTGNNKANILEVGEYAHQIDYEKIYKDGLIDNEEYEILSNALYRINNTSMGGRLTYWAFAVKEFLNSPLIGNGPLHYANLGYDYPHNIFLELASGLRNYRSATIHCCGCYGMYSNIFYLEK